MVSKAFFALGQRGDERAVTEILKRIKNSDHWSAGFGALAFLAVVIFWAIGLNPLAHPFYPAIPVTQVVGGLLFAVAYEVEKNLMVPITIHILGNMALFTLSLVG